MFSIETKKAALILRAINHDLRRKIYDYIKQSGKITVTEIYRHLDLEQSVASQHLAILRRAGFVKTERDRRFIYYTVNEPRLQQVKEFSEQLIKEDA